MTNNAPIDEGLLEILVCPLTRSKLTSEDGMLVAEVGGLRYPIREGIPVLLPESAELPEGYKSLEEFKERMADQIPD